MAFYWNDYKTAVFVNGCFWHRHEGCKYAYTPKSSIEFWEAKFARTVELDKEKNEALKEKGWHVFIAWECELKKNPTLVLDRLFDAFKGNC